MSMSSIQRALIPAACIAGTVFAVSTAPLAMYRSEVVAVELKNRPLFAAEVRDLAGPYLGLTGMMSVSIGASILGFAGWRQASRKSEAAESKLSGLEQNLLVQQSELEAVKFSEARLRAQHLDAFLEPQSPVEAANQQVQRAPLAAVPNPNAAHIASVSPATPVASSPAALVNNPNETSYVSYTGLIHRQTSPTNPVNVAKDKAMMALSAAQSYASYTRSSGVVDSAVNGPGNGNVEGVQLDHLLVQLKELATQVEELRAGSSNGLAA
ncbi:MAG: hypothetical protein ICV62_04615 [Cyanobacteria bacterium Co-bin13]|nr:hypothetical protein [Cyanobacteria bacterium Co-bin13]